MARVTAMTLADADREIPARQVVGEHQTRWVPTLEYAQHFVDGVLVDGRTIAKQPEEDGGENHQLRGDRPTKAQKFARTTDDESFRRAIDENPHDDAPKLIYADYLAENGRENEERIWREMANAKGDEDLHPKGVLFEHGPYTQAGFDPMRDGLLGRISDRTIGGVGRSQLEPLIDELGPPMGEGEADDNMAYSYISAKDPADSRKIAERIDRENQITRLHEAIAFPINSKEVWHKEIRDSERKGPLSSVGDIPPRHFLTGHADYLVGKPTAVADLIHRIRQNPIPGRQGKHSEEAFADPPEEDSDEEF